MCNEERKKTVLTNILFFFTQADDIGKKKKARIKEQSIKANKIDVKRHFQSFLSCI